MKSEFVLRLADLAIPGLPTGPIVSADSQRKAIRAIEDEYQLFRRIGSIEVTFQGEFVRVAFTSNDRIDPIDVAISELKAGRVSEGIELLQFLHANSPDDPNVLYFLGSSLSDLGDLAHAESYLRRALEIRPNFPDALVNLGVALSRLNKTDEAVEILKKAVEFDPKNAFAHRNLGAGIAKLGRDIAAAQAHLEHAVQLAPMDIQSWLGLAGVYKTQGNFAAAKEACTKVLQIAPQSPLAPHARAMLQQL